MRFAELQLGGGQCLEFALQLFKTDSWTRAVQQDKWVKKKVDGQIDEAVLFIDSHTRQSITPCFSSAYLSRNRCALSVFLR